MTKIHTTVVKSNTIELAFVASSLNPGIEGVRTKTGWHWIMIMYSSGATCLYCISVLSCQ
jgi:hypothetical protein